jgi:hypothetical protein
MKGVGWNDSTEKRVLGGKEMSERNGDEMTVCKYSRV